MKNAFAKIPQPCHPTSSQPRPRNHLLDRPLGEPTVTLTPPYLQLSPNHKMDPYQTCTWRPCQICHQSAVGSRKVGLSIKGSEVRPTDGNPKDYLRASPARDKVEPLVVIVIFVVIVVIVVGGGSLTSY